MMDERIHSELSTNIFRAAESLQSLLDRRDAGLEVAPRELEQARLAAATVSTVADLLAVGAHLLGGVTNSQCRVCQIRHRNLPRIVLTICSEHSRGPVPKEPAEEVAPADRTRDEEVLDYLSRLFGHNRRVACVLCSVEIGGMARNPLGKPPIGEGPLRNGAILMFELCNYELLC